MYSYVNTNMIPVESERDSEREREPDVLAVQATEDAFSVILAAQCISGYKGIRDNIYKF